MSGQTRLESAVVGVLVLLGWASAQSAGAVTRQVFVTSTTGSGDLSSWAETNQTGLDGADEICRVRAAAASLPNAATYRAWISSSTTDAFCHLFGLTGSKPGCGGANPNAALMGPWLRRDGSPFAATLDEMTGSGHEVYQPIRFDETGAAVPDIYFHAWTGTNENGVRRGSTCADWGSASPGAYGDTGIAWMVGEGWSYNVTMTCDYTQYTRLYCFELGQGDPIHRPSEPGSLVFVTSVAGNGNLSTWADANGQSGIAAGDAICRARATAAGLPYPESFVAWLSDATTNARDRVTVGGPFVRVDGFVFALTKLGITSLSPDLRTGLNVTELGSYYLESPNPYVWTGTEWNGAVSLYTCDGWTSSLGTDLGAAGSSDTTRYTWSSSGSPYCNGSRPIYCFSNLDLLFGDAFESGATSRWSYAAP